MLSASFQGNCVEKKTCTAPVGPYPTPVAAKEGNRATEVPVVQVTTQIARAGASNV